MLNFREYKEQYLNELTRIAKHYKDNSYKIKNPIKGINDNFNSKITYDELMNYFLSNNIVYKTLQDDISNLIEKYKNHISKKCFSKNIDTYNCISSIKITNDNKQLIILQNKIKAFREYSINYLEKIGIRKGGVDLEYIFDAFKRLRSWKRW